MPATLRLTKTEQKLLREKCIEINKVLIGRELPPMQESELAHEILDKSIKFTKVGKSGELLING